MLHEIGGSSRSWDRAGPLLASRFELLACDQRGFGMSEKVRAQHGTIDLVDDLARILAEAEWTGPVTLVAAAGSSAVAAAFAQKFPERVKSLVLCAPALIVEPSARDNALGRADAVQAEGMRTIVDAAMDRMYPAAIRDEWFETYRMRFLACDPVGFALANRAFAAGEASLAGLAMPILVLAGDADIRSPEQTRAMLGGAPYAQLKVIARAGHLMAWQAPEAVAAAISTFC
ncbi:alpha/beta fold hydrolase [Novosphingobium sp. BL-52-GroH]|uniref:alpha/beta fold hydrolase n=1 Tax=Novosphingobium sp. BL-52-GroH TaxID=3349877 RepID=UPI00384A619E